jgi:hypothetical protein
MDVNVQALVADGSADSGIMCLVPMVPSLSPPTFLPVPSFMELVVEALLSIIDGVSTTTTDFRGPDEEMLIESSLTPANSAIVTSSIDRVN